ncbi:hypothetical protein KIL84_019531 [Mauremys mutica]|uniref:Uncharacterized protein n=1 Tax=Mauremys mutica TaxID=74926 RepID=A0A9D3XVT8_9SAUR|nr:hypothetical protein KIL84_019531 [Mauremys mutica]
MGIPPQAPTPGPRGSFPQSLGIPPLHPQPLGVPPLHPLPTARGDPTPSPYSWPLGILPPVLEVPIHLSTTHSPWGSHLIAQGVCPTHMSRATTIQEIPTSIHGLEHTPMQENIYSPTDYLIKPHSTNPTRSPEEHPPPYCCPPTHGTTPRRIHFTNPHPLPRKCLPSTHPPTTWEYSPLPSCLTGGTSNQRVPHSPGQHHLSREHPAKHPSPNPHPQEDSFLPTHSR